MSYILKTCRHCLGDGCLCCNHKGQIRQTLWSRADIAAAKLRHRLFDDIKNTIKLTPIKP